MRNMTKFNEELEDFKYTLQSKWSSFRYFFRRIYWFFLRGKKGWAPNDTWNLNNSLARVIAEQLKYLAHHSNGYPGTFTEQSWTDYLLDIAKSFDEYCNYDGWQLKEWQQMYKIHAGVDFEKRYKEENWLWNKLPDIPREIIEAHYTKIDLEYKRIIEGMKRIFDNWGNLWD